MNGFRRTLAVSAIAILVISAVVAADLKVDRSGEPNPDRFRANNPVLRPPVSGRVGLWAKTDSTSYFKDYEVAAR